MRFLSIILTFLLLVNIFAPALVLGQEEKREEEGQVIQEEKQPYSLEELEKMIRDGVLEDERIIELLYENGLSFYPDEKAIARLKRAGASDQVIEAVRIAEHPEKPVPIKERKPLYKRWWFLGAAAVVVGGTVALIAKGEDKKPRLEPIRGFPNPPTKR